MCKVVAEKHPKIAAQLSKSRNDEFQATTYEDLFRQVAALAGGLLEEGVSRGDRVGIICDNRREWIICDLAILSIGAIDVPRGCDSSIREISYILRTAECKSVIVESVEQLAVLSSIREELPFLELAVLIEGDAWEDSLFSPDADISVRTYAEIFRRGVEFTEKHPQRIGEEIEKGENSDTATILFTSGTTGEPKGVMLSHENFLHQVRCIPDIVSTTPGEICLSVLPIWHSFERIMEYVILSLGCTIAYSRPIGSIMLADFATLRPQWMAAVPRVWEGIKDGINRKFRTESVVIRMLYRFFLGVGSAHSYFYSMLRGLLPQYKKRLRTTDILYSVLPLCILTPIRAVGDLLIFDKIREKMGGRFLAGFSAGGSLSPAVSTFYSSLGLRLLNGYGLTESSPLLALQLQHAPVVETVGPPIADTAIRIVGEDSKEVHPGTKGLILARGPQVMQGYYGKPEETAKVLDSDGWLNTGDLGLLTYGGELVITGRVKDTIVLLGGENVEPMPIEQLLQTSDYIEQAVVLGQDRKFLGALIVPATDALAGYLESRRIPVPQDREWKDIPEVVRLITTEIQDRINRKNGFRYHERIFRFALLNKSFEADRELSHKLEVKRHVLKDFYRREIDDLFS